MTPQQENALRSIARQANLKSKKPDSSFRIKTSMTFAVRTKEAPRNGNADGIHTDSFNLAIGMLNGVFKER